jgi:bifunctional non-homologous end joining protein LigD
MGRAKSSLRAYRAKRDFSVTPEPAGDTAGKGGELSFVVQKHWARRLHYDFRLELDGTMKSWAVPKGPSLDPHDKRLAVHVEDHPISYSSFEGTIPARQYGAGKVIVWDRGTWQPIGNARSAYRAGNLKFELHGEKLHGQWALVRIKASDDKERPWLLIKHQDDYARPAAGYSLVEELPDSVTSAAKRGSKRRSKRSAATRAKPRKPAEEPAEELPAEATRAALPRQLTPELATLVAEIPPDPGEWRYEIKFDGYRLLVRVDDRKIQLMTRNGLDWSARFPALLTELTRLALPAGWYDGEVVALNGKGVPDFGRLQASFEESQARDAILYLFDVPFHRGFDLRAAPLSARRALLARVLAARTSASVRFSDEFKDEPASILASACRLGLEGVIAKRADSPYVSRRSTDWIKLKCGKRQEFVIGGYTDPEGSRQVLGSLLLGVYGKDGTLHYAGNVGAGFDAAALRSLAAPLKRLTTTRRPFEATAAIPRRPHWVRPTLVAEVSFSEWTRDGRLRHPVFQGLRKDKDPKSIRREEAVMPERVANKTAATKKRAARVAAVTPAASARLTHGERVIDAASGATKADLFAYYEAAGPLLLPHLVNRPASLVRAPAGLAGQKFFQKHVGAASLRGITPLEARLDPDNPPMLAINSLEGIASAAQWNVVEFHTQNATAADYERPDRIIFDLDPGERVSWPTVREGARLLNTLLGELGLAGFLKTSGGKGLHVVVPVRAKLGWDAVRDLAGAVTDHMAKTIPARFVAKSGGRNRVGKIFIDYLRNGRGSTTVAAWSARARAGLGISVPISWEELDDVKSADQWTIANARPRFKSGNTPWDGYDSAAADLAPAIGKLGKRARKK